MKNQNNLYTEEEMKKFYTWNDDQITKLLSNPSKSTTINGFEENYKENLQRLCTFFLKNENLQRFVTSDANIIINGKTLPKGYDQLHNAIKKIRQSFDELKECKIIKVEQQDQIISDDHQTYIEHSKIIVKVQKHDHTSCIMREDGIIEAHLKDNKVSYLNIDMGLEVVASVSGEVYDATELL